MKKFLTLILAFASFATASAQRAVSMDIYYKTADGELSYEVKKGDQLVYHVNAGGSEYDFIVTINKFNNDDGIDFDYEMTNTDNTKGHVTISKEAADKARKYVNYFRGGELALTDASAVWLSYTNFTEMPTKKTTMSFDGGEMETMYRPDNDEVTPTVKIKGEDRKIDGFMINNKKDGKGDKTMWVHGISSNPLILKMDLGWTIELKEIR